MNNAVRVISVSLLGFTLACGTSAKAPVDTTADEAAIRAIDASWNNWLGEHNDSAIGAIYAADAVLLPPNMPRVTGAVGIRSFWAGLWPLKATLVLAPVTIRVNGDWALEEGNYSMTIPAPAGETRDAGKFLVSWHKADGKWHAVKDIWNSDYPPPASPAVKK